MEHAQNIQRRAQTNFFRWSN